MVVAGAVLKMVTLAAADVVKLWLDLPVIDCHRFESFLKMNFLRYSSSISSASFVTSTLWKTQTEVCHELVPIPSALQGKDWYQ